MMIIQGSVKVYYIAFWKPLTKHLRIMEELVDGWIQINLKIQEITIMVDSFLIISTTL